MKIAYNSAYARQAVIVCFYHRCNFQEITMPNTKYYCTSWISFWQLFWIIH